MNLKFAGAFFCMFLSFCKKSDSENEVKASVSSSQTLAKWCHVNLAADDGSKIKVDFQIQSENTQDLETFLATPTWINFSKDDLSKDDQIRAVLLRKEYFWMNGKSKADLSGKWDLDLSYKEQESKFTVEVPSKLALLTVQSGARKYAAYAEVAFVRNGVWLKDSLTQRNNFEIDFFELSNQPQNCDP